MSTQLWQVVSRLHTHLASISEKSMPSSSCAPLVGDILRVCDATRGSFECVVVFFSGEVESTEAKSAAKLALSSQNTGLSCDAT